MSRKRKRTRELYVDATKVTQFKKTHIHPDQVRSRPFAVGDCDESLLENLWFIGTGWTDLV